MIFPNPIRFLWAVLVSTYGRLRGYEVLADFEVIEERTAQCDPCPFRRGEQCGICTCFIDAKVMLNLEQCPKRKWLRRWVKRYTI